MDDRFTDHADDMSEMPGMTEEELAAMDAARQKAREKELEPYKKASQQRRESAEIIQEHDDMLADMLFEMTMNEMEG